MSNMIRIMHIFTNGNNKFIRRPLSRKRDNHRTKNHIVELNY